MTTIKAILKTPIQIFEKPIFSFRRTYEAAVSNSKILVLFNGYLGAAIEAKKDSQYTTGRNSATQRPWGDYSSITRTGLISSK